MIKTNLSSLSMKINVINTKMEILLSLMKSKAWPNLTTLSLLRVKSKLISSRLRTAKPFNSLSRLTRQSLMIIYAKELLKM